MSDTAATPSNRTRLVMIGIAGLVVLGWLYYRENSQVVHRTISGTVSAIDAASRRVTIRVVHPKTGQQIELTGEVPADCPITIDGKTATLAAVQIGDVAEAEGVLARSNQRIVASNVKIKRAAAPGSAPASSPTRAATGARP